MPKSIEKKDEKNARQLLVSRSGLPLLWAHMASTCRQRFKGLFAYPPLSESQALILSPCSAVHTIGFSYTIDVAFLCAEGRILKAGTLNPWSVMMCRGARCVMEMPEGTVRRLDLQAGQQLDVSSGGVDTLPWRGHVSRSYMR